jgi:hypothetical protein
MRGADALELLPLLWMAENGWPKWEALLYFPLFHHLSARQQRIEPLRAHSPSFNATLIDLPSLFRTSAIIFCGPTKCNLYMHRRFYMDAYNNEDNNKNSVFVRQNENNGKE